MVYSPRETPPRPGQALSQPTATALLSQILEEQRKTNELLGMLISALSQEDEPDPDLPPAHYLDGAPVR